MAKVTTPGSAWLNPEPVSFIRHYWKYFSTSRIDLIFLQLHILARPLLGGVGFLLVIPLLNLAGLGEPSGSGLAYQVLQILPGQLDLASVLLIFILLNAGAAGLSYSGGLLGERFRQQIIVNLRTDLSDGVIHCEWAHLHRTHHADYTRILTEDVGAVSAAIDQIIQLVSQSVLILVYLALCLLLSPGLTVIAVILGICLVTATLMLRQLVNRIGHAHLDIESSIYRQTGEQLDGLREIKTRGAEQLHLSRFSSAAKELSETELQYARLNGLTQLTHSLLAVLAFAIITWYALGLPEADPAVLVVLALVFSRLLGPVSSIQSCIAHLSYLQPSIATVTDLLALTRVHREPEGNSTDLPHPNRLVLTDIGYHYPGLEVPAITDFNLTMTAGQFVAITGPSGAGKSTLADIIAGVSLPTSGSFLIDGQVLTSENRRSWRHHVIYVPQEPFLVDASVRSNLTLFIDDTTMEDPVTDTSLWKALDKASAGFVRDLPEGLDTWIGEDGVSFSAGERQRLLIARALLEDRPVLILDETTSNLDLETESQVLTALKSLQGPDRIIILISHRHSVEQIADLVVKVEKNSRR